MRKTTTKSNIVGLKELREDMDKYIARVDKGESFTVVRRSRPVFKIAPVDEESGWETVVDFTQIDKKGVLAEEVLAALRRIK
jgi:prevent-host-death family protein